MNVHVRFFSVATLAALVAGAPLAAQSASLPDSDVVSSASAVSIAVPTALGNVSGGPASATGGGGTVAPGAPAERSAARGPSLAAARVANHAVSAPIGAPPVIQNRSTNRNAVALMAVGGAALVVGAVIGEDAGTLVMLGGAVVGLYGLYLFLT